jgi:integrase
MGVHKVRLADGSTAFGYRLWVGGKEIRKRSFATRQLAEIALGKHREQLTTRAVLGLPAHRDLTYEDLLDRYLAHAETVQKPRTFDTTQVWIRRLQATFGELPLSEFTIARCEHFLHGLLAEGLAPATVSRHLEVLKHSLSMAVRWGLINANPIREAQVPVKVKNERLRWLTLDEIDQLLAVAPVLWRRWVLIALHTGMRKAEIVRLERRRVHQEGFILLKEGTKTEEFRSIPLTGTLRSLFAEIDAELAAEGYTGPWVFHNPKTGKPYRADTDTAWYTMLRESGIRNFHFHDLRHTCGSYLALAGEDIRVIQAILGHKDIKSTVRYTHVAPSRQRSAVAALEKQYDLMRPPEYPPEY